MITVSDQASKVTTPVTTIFDQIVEVAAKLGRDIQSARRRRHISVDTLALYANISRTTLYRIETGDPAVALGHYAAVLSRLGKTNLKRFADAADPAYDPWSNLEEEHLPKRIRARHLKTIAKTNCR